MNKKLLSLKLLGSPSVFLDQEEVFFPFAKISAFFQVASNPASIFSLMLRGG